eukprot:TRINITY_DN15444_c0_g1_i1.p1 TRINITY_DN15444_c0_g1~~TRINITY_DN15444_c0_g1_i1.p1  ORF type:complete len:555 (-),score=111.97 TRINITY_DN15444_c0_g1_i1:209-1810(-)
MAPSAATHDYVDDEQALQARRELQKAHKHIMQIAKSEKNSIMRTRRQMQQERKEAFAELRPQALSERPWTPGELGRAAAALTKRRGSSSCSLLNAFKSRSGLPSTEDAPAGGRKRSDSRWVGSPSSPKQGGSSPTSSPKAAETQKVTLRSMKSVQWFHRSIVRQQVLKQKFDFLYKDIQQEHLLEFEAEAATEAKRRASLAGSEVAMAPPEGTVEARRQLANSSLPPTPLASTASAPDLRSVASRVADALMPSSATAGERSAPSSRPQSASGSAAGAGMAAAAAQSPKNAFGMRVGETAAAAPSQAPSRAASRPSSASAGLSPAKEDDAISEPQLLPGQNPTEDDPTLVPETMAQPPSQRIAWSPSPTAAAAVPPPTTLTAAEPKNAARSQAASAWKLNATGPSHQSLLLPKNRSGSCQARRRNSGVASAGQCSNPGGRRGSNGGSQRSLRRSASSGACQASRRGGGHSALLSAVASATQLAAEIQLEPVRDDYYGGDDCLLHEDILYSSNPRLFPLKQGPAKPFPLMRLAEC